MKFGILFLFSFFTSIYSISIWADLFADLQLERHEIKGTLEIRSYQRAWKRLFSQKGHKVVGLGLFFKPEVMSKGARRVFHSSSLVYIVLYEKGNKKVPLLSLYIPAYRLPKFGVKRFYFQKGRGRWARIVFVDSKRLSSGGDKDMLAASYFGESGWVELSSPISSEGKQRAKIGKEFVSFGFLRFKVRVEARLSSPFAPYKMDIKSHFELPIFWPANAKASSLFQRTLASQLVQ